MGYDFFRGIWNLHRVILFLSSAGTNYHRRCEQFFTFRPRMRTISKLPINYVYKSSEDNPPDGGAAPVIFRSRTVRRLNLEGCHNMKNARMFTILEDLDLSHLNKVQRLAGGSFHGPTARRLAKSTPNINFLRKQQFFWSCGSGGGWVGEGGRGWSGW